MTKYIDFYLERDDFSSRLGEGIPKGSLFIVEGEDGSGKSIVAQRIAYGALVNGHSVAYISTELTTLDFVKQMASLNYNIEKYLLEKKLLYIPLVSLFGKVKKGKNIIFELKKSKARKIFDYELVIIDSLSYPLINGISDEEMFDLINFLLKMKYKDIVIMVTYNPKELSESAINSFRRVSDIYLKTYHTTIAGQLVKAIEVVRFRNPKREYQLVIPYRIEVGLGLVVEIISII